MNLNEKLDQNRWSIHKLGIINYWFYDEEELNFLDGRLILRGENGSGKSVTMQAFIPLLFDGNRSSERLDSFGTKAKKIEDYVLGYNEFEKEENTSYLYMEFKKKETQNYLTIGIGLHAKKGKPTNFYGFVIKDSRRIGKDIFLYKSRENKIPLSKIELKNLIGQGGSVVESQKEYMALVNENLFGFESLDEYSEFIKLIIDVRKPKLSKDGYKPSDITKIMSDSLRALNDEDLRPVSESIENMNKTKEQLEILKVSNKALSNILKSYETYNSCVIFHKSLTFVNADKEYEKVIIIKKEIENKIKQLKEELRSLEENLEENKKEYDGAKAKDEELSKSDIYQKKSELIQMDEKIKVLNTSILGKEEQLQQKNGIKKQRDEEYAKKEMEKYHLEKELKDINSELLELSKEFKFDSYAFTEKEIFENITQKYDYSSLKNELEQYNIKISNVLERLKVQQEKEKNYDREIQEFDFLNDKKSKQDKIISKNRGYFGTIKEEYIEKVYEWENRNTIFKLTDKNRANILAKLNVYGDTATFDDIIQYLRVDYDRLRDDYREKILQNQSVKNMLLEKIENHNNEINEWKTKKEPEPMRAEAVILNRENLVKAGIRCKSFYELVDFKSTVSDAIKSKIESALNDMGILDALVIKKEDLEKALKIDTLFVDRYLVAKPTVLKNDASALFDIIGEEKSLNIQVDEILRSILVDEDENITYIGEDGAYQIGILKGKVSHRYTAKYIGVEARKKYKFQKITILQEEIDMLLLEEKAVSNTIEQMLASMEILQSEWEGFPKKEDIEVAYVFLKDSIMTMNSIKEDMMLKQERVHQSALELKIAKEQVLEISQRLYFSLNVNTYEEALKTGLEFSKTLFAFQNIHDNIVNVVEYLTSIATILEEIKEDIDTIESDIYHANEELNKISTKKNITEKMISSDYSQIEQEITQCKEKLERLPLEKETILKNIYSDSTKLEYEQIEYEKIGKSIDVTEKLKDMTKDIFQKEMSLGYVKLQDEIVPELDKKEHRVCLQYANAYITKFHGFAKDIKGIDYYLDNLMANFRDNAGELNEYNITRKELFTNEASAFSEEVNNEIKKVAASYMRKDLCGFFKGKSLNLKELHLQIVDTIAQMGSLIEEGDRELFEDILTNTIGSKIRRKIYDAKIWIKNINVLLDSIDSKITFSFNWKPKNAETEEQMDTRELVDILNSDTSLLREDEVKKVAKHFRSKINKAEQRLDEKGNVKSLHTLMKEALDYREWFGFEFYYLKKGEQKKELTNNAFFKLSGGEKAMAMYIPLFAAVFARLEGANKDALRIIALDEAFAGVDEKNIANMFGILTELKIDYIINSQILWGDYETIPNIAIYQLIKSDETRTVALSKYLWNGKKLDLIK